MHAMAYASKITVLTSAVLAVLLAFAAQAPGADASRLVLCCREENDLYRVLQHNRVPCLRADTAEQAVVAAGRGGAVMVLADGYPERTTTIGQAVLDAAASRKLRLFVEYPGALAGLELDKPRRADLERVVSGDDFFARDLPRLRILAVNGLHFVPARGGKAHLVAAKVAGFDTAVYGLPKTTWPILLEHPRGDILVATTKLSHFLTGRYAPQDAWRAVWAGVLTWLLPGTTLPPLRWMQTVRPAYGREDPLPADAELAALRRGAGWFRTSKLLMHPSRKDEVARSLGSAPHPLAGAGLVPTPPPDAPIGDGSMGILEGPLSHIQYDGSQLQSVSIRGDCNGESAMAMALGGKVLGDKELPKIACNVLDFYLFTSDARKKERGDPSHGAYGLVAWGITTPAWYCANYGDDNARLMMGTLAAAAATGQDRWNEAMTLCLLANLRTTGQLGFRSDRVDIGPLSRGWMAFFRRRIVSYSPHMEAYLWACFLWAYERTGDKLFLDRARTAIAMTMNTYTDGWRWMNGLAQEKARILLPLAWLVRVEDTPQHRKWLRQAVDGVVALQQPCGAIREELGMPGRGAMPPPRSNEDYGRHEASLIQQTGDPVCDLLYTSNFALLGLHEAAAAGDQKARQAEDRLAEFLVRIQVRSEAHPSLDGGWFRAFDFNRWEHWASNADAGWGAWAIESGWTQGWIVSVLALRQMKTNLWDLTAGLKIKPLHAKLRPVMIPQEAVESLTPEPIAHAAVGKKLTLTHAYDKRYPAGGDTALVDGVLGTVDYHDGSWQGYHGKDLEAVIDLGRERAISSVASRYLQTTSVGIYLPVEVEYAVSRDGKAFTVAAKVKSTVSQREAGPLIEAFTASLRDVTARYLRVRAWSVGKIPDWHQARGLPAWLFVDEILVDPPPARTGKSKAE